MCESRAETVSDLKPARSGSCRPGWFLVDLAVIVLLGDLTERVGYYSFVGTRPIAMTDQARHDSFSPRHDSPNKRHDNQPYYLFPDGGTGDSRARVACWIRFIIIRVRMDD